MSTSSAPSPAPAKNERRSSGVFIPTLVVIAIIIVALTVLSSVWTQVRWFSQIGAAQVFWKQWGWSLLLGVAGVLVIGGLTYLNFRLAKPRESVDSLGARRSGSSQYRKQVEAHPWIVRLVIPLTVGVVFGAPLANEWRTYLTWFNRTAFGTTDAQFGKDVGFYVFSLPVLHSVLSFLLSVLIVGTIAAVIGHYVFGGIETADGKVSLNKRARIHFGILGAFASAMVAGHLWLGRYDMLLANNPKFAGASFTDINASLPGRQILAIAALFVAVLFVVAAAKGIWKLAITGISVGVVASMIVLWAYPALVQNFRVTPNAVEMESPYIQRNIDATLTAYGLEDVENTNYTAQTTAEAGLLREDADTTTQIRLLDPTVVSPTFNQLQQNRQYYAFSDDLSVDRYTINDERRDTVLAVRELNLDGLDSAQRTWVNDHTVYTHGYGIAAAYGNTTTKNGAPTFFQRDIPSTGELGEYEPRVYFGERSPNYSIVGAPKSEKPWEIDYPDDTTENGQVLTTYTGDGGPKLSNSWEKLMYAIKFRSTDMFFSDRVTEQSQILYDRDPADRVSKVAPYLTLDSKAYPAVVDMDGNDKTPKRLVWIIDAYTTSNSYPYSARTSLASATKDAQSTGVSILGGDDEVNYVRNSVKAVVDAYDGSVSLFAWDDQDPVLKAWGNIFPGMLSPVSEMSGDLLAHVRYPEDLFKIQRTLLTKYHVKDAAAFYSGGDFWNVPKEPTESSETTTKQPPYFLTLQMPNQDAAAFSLTTSFVPGGTTNRNVMTGFLAADSDAGNEAGKVREGYGKLRLLELPRDSTVPGPGQAQNRFLTDGNVSQTLNLLRNGGTKVKMGNLLSLPVGGGLLYIQPVYVSASSGTQYPLLQYVLTAFGDGNIGFAPTLDEALDQTFGGDSGASAGDANIDKPDKTSPIIDPTAEPTPDPTKDPEPGSAQERLDQALKDAQTALNDANGAMSKNDWAAYGKAQEALEKAITQAVTAKQELEKK